MIGPDRFKINSVAVLSVINLVSIMSMITVGTCAPSSRRSKRDTNSLAPSVFRNSSLMLNYYYFNEHTQAFSLCL